MSPQLLFDDARPFRKKKGERREGEGKREREGVARVGAQAFSSSGSVNNISHTASVLTEDKGGERSRRAAHARHRPGP